MIKNLTDAIIVVIVVLWAGSIVLGMVDRQYQMPTTLQVVMGGVAAFLFGNKFFKNGNPKNGKGEKAK